jgi:mono/diheme cytochrome c family protein
MMNFHQKSLKFAFGFLSIALMQGFALSVMAQTADKGKLVYDTYCLACHQIDGSGVPALNPTLQGTSFVKGDKTRLIGIVLNGLKNTEIDGEMYDNPMPPFASLSDEDIAAVLTYVRSNFTNKEAAVKAEEVTTVRKGK